MEHRNILRVFRKIINYKTGGKKNMEKNENEILLDKMVEISQKIILLSISKDTTTSLLKELIRVHTESLKNIVRDSFVK
jgi:hypothetical protein